MKKRNVALTHLKLSLKPEKHLEKVIPLEIETFHSFTDWDSHRRDGLTENPRHHHHESEF